MEARVASESGAELVVGVAPTMAAQPIKSEQRTTGGPATAAGPSGPSGSVMRWPKSRR